MAELDFSNLTFDFDLMSARDRWDFEDATNGKDLEDWVNLWKQGVINPDNFLRREQLNDYLAFIWLCIRQQDPSVTFDEVLEHPLAPIWEASVDMKYQAPRLEALEKRLESRDAAAPKPVRKAVRKTA